VDHCAISGRDWSWSNTTPGYRRRSAQWLLATLDDVNRVRQMNWIAGGFGTTSRLARGEVHRQDDPGTVPAVNRALAGGGGQRDDRVEFSTV
jgi:hypothetical protein